ncbi:MAG: HipA domain-containing protein [Campylobacterota bacterium]|nr:HipA domain-containing protein [Campylobacterota bacterium]
MGDNRLKITIADKVVAFMWVNREEETYQFEYTKEWIKNGFAVSPHLQLNEFSKSGIIRRFLENIIPEGKGLEDITQFAHISKNNTFAIIKAIGFDTSGALMFGRHTNKQEEIFRAITDNELANRITNIEDNSIAIWDKKERLSLAGVQEKLPVIVKDGQIGLGDGLLSSTHIMKFQTKKHANIVVNELFCMKLAQKINLNVAEVELYRFKKHPVLMVKRFDRVYKEHRVERLHVIDGCQMLDLSSTYKYERNFGSGRDVKDIREGASFTKLFKSADICEVPARAKLEMLNWSIFNLIIGNSDAHGKNFSFFVDKRGIRPTPFYDMLCIIAHENVEHDLAMAYGDEFNPDEVKAYQLREFADAIGLNFKLVSQAIDKIANSILKSLEDDIVSSSDLINEEKLFIDKLRALILKRAIQFKDISSQMCSVTY